MSHQFFHMISHFDSCRQGWGGDMGEGRQIEGQCQKLTTLYCSLCYKNMQHIPFSVVKWIISCPIMSLTFGYLCCGTEVWCLKNFHKIQLFFQRTVWVFPLLKLSFLPSQSVCKTHSVGPFLCYCFTMLFLKFQAYRPLSRELYNENPTASFLIT